MNYPETLQYMEGLLGSGMKLGLENISLLLERMGSPQNQVPAIHVGGSNGKGSVCAFLSSILVEAGYRVGLSTSPHLVNLEERIALDNNPISPEMLAEAVTHVRGQVEALQAEGILERTPTYYEFLVATSFHVFHANRCDFQIIEVGMGGRLDATNTMKKPLLCVVTRIDMEHTAHLGSTLEKIAVEKAGIARPGVPVVTYEGREETLKALRDAARQKGATLIEARRDSSIEMDDDGNAVARVGRMTYKDLSIPLPGRHQRENLLLALRIVEQLKTQGFEITQDHVALGVERTRWPGRLEMVRNHPTLLLDGAHNPAGAAALVTYLDTMPKDGKLLLIFGAMKDKDIVGVMETLLPRAAQVFLTRAAVQRSEDPENLARMARPLHEHITVVPDPGEALEQALAQAEQQDVVLVAGSLILVGDIHRYLAAGEG
ncbi:MAG: folylpolyglutamate synthase/dihydrofolate synthase family protein [Planctomycetota bacterium]